MKQAVKRAAHHDERRHLFLLLLHKSFNIDAHEVEVEKGIRVAQVRGYIDALYQDLVFEFKRNLDKEREVGIEELVTYLTSLGEKSFGVLTDGLIFETYVLKSGKLQILGKPVDLDSLSSDPASALSWFEAFLFSQKNLQPRSEDLVKRFGADSPVFSSAASQLESLWTQVAAQTETQVKFVEWTRLLAMVYGTPDIGDINLFVRHSYLSLLAKVFAYIALFKAIPTEYDELTGIVSGSVFAERGFPNLSEPDFFSWVLDGLIIKDSVRLLRGLAQHLQVYDLTKVNEDLLKELYQDLVDPEARHELGEYYTPDWLAEETLNIANYSGTQSVLDPSCGSGTFLFTAIRQSRKAGLKGKSLVDFALNNILGVDVHPLAVITARINYVLALVPDLKDYKGSVQVPVYMADSLLHEERRKTGEPIEVPITSTPHKKSPGAFLIPAVAARDPLILDDVLQIMCDYSKQDGTKQELRDGFFKYIENKDGIGETSQWMNNIDLMIDLVRDHRDTIWGFILRNAYRPIFLAARRFDLVVGNPPWLAYRFIQEARYQQEIKKLTFEYGLLDRKNVKLFTVMDTSTVFFEFCFNRYRNMTGTLAFVMPKSVLTGAKQHAAFQKGGFTTVLDLEGVRPLFNVPACVLVRDSTSKLGQIPMLELRGTLPKKNLPLEDAKHFVSKTQENYTPLIIGTPLSEYYDSFKQGAALVPQSLWFIRPRIVQGIELTDPKKPFLESDPLIKAASKKEWKKVTINGFVESRFLYCTLLTRHLVAFGWTELNLTVVPLKDAGSHLAIIRSKEALAQGYPGLADWLDKCEKLFNKFKKKTTKSDIYGWIDYRKKLSEQHPSGCFKVLHNRSGTNLVACVIDAGDAKTLTVHGLKTNGLINFGTTHDYDTEDEREAHYLCAILNADIVNEVIKPYQTKGLFGERDIYRRAFELLPIAKYDKNDRLHNELAELSKFCHRRVAEFLAEMPNANIGKKRRDLRKLLKPELAKADFILQKLFLGAIPTARRKLSGTPSLFE